MVDLQDILVELDNINGTHKIRDMIIKYVESMELCLLQYQEAKEKEIESLIYYTRIDEDET